MTTLNMHPTTSASKDTEFAALLADRDNWKDICLMYNTKYSEGTVEIAALREAAKLALAALNWNKSYLPNGHPSTLSNGAITALCQALGVPNA